MPFVAFFGFVTTNIIDGIIFSVWSCTFMQSSEFKEIHVSSENCLLILNIVFTVHVLNLDENSHWIVQQAIEHSITAKYDTLDMNQLMQGKKVQIMGKNDNQG